jgi:signal transduction histidine kinase
MAIHKAFSLSVRSSLRAKVTLGVILPLVLVLGIFTMIEYRRHQEISLIKLSSLASQSGKIIDSSLRNAMLESNFSEVQTILDSIDASSEFRVIYVMDTNGNVVFAPNSQGVGSQLNNEKPDCQPCHRLEPNERPSSVVVVAADGQQVFRSMYPIKNAQECSVCHNPAQPLIGLLLTDIPVAPMKAALVSDFRETILWWIGTILVTVMVVNLTMSRIIIRPLTGLVHAIKNFGQEGQDLRLPVGDLDELGRLTKAFNTLGQRIEAEAAANQSLSDRLRRQNIQRGELLKHLITAQEDERKRVSREIHDDLGQSLGALSLQIQALERLITKDTNSALEQLSQIQSLIDETMERMYDLILALRPSALDDLGLVAALRTHAERFLSGSGIRFELNTDGISGRLPPDIETALRTPVCWV